jgi:RimJ/RimL family protein N-acetyltransferase
LGIDRLSEPTGSGTDNRAARRFYERHGYREVGVLSGLIAEGIDEVLYRKTRGPIRGYRAPGEL